MISLQVIQDCLPSFSAGMLKTVGLVVTSYVGGTVLGFLLNTLRRLGPVWTGKMVAAYVTLFRGTPFLAQLYLIYFGLPVLHVSLDPAHAAIFSLTLYTAAYVAEIFRGCWNTLPAGQHEAARILGIGRWSAFIHLETPQALRLAIPLLTNQAILTLKESSLASLITYPELSLAASRIVAEQFVYVEPYLLLAIAYWILSLLVQGIGQGIRHHFGRNP